MRPEEDPHSRALYQLSTMIIQLLRFPTPSLIRRRNNNLNSFPFISPISLASLFLGISFTLILFGSVTFLIGFMLLPCVIGFFLISYFDGLFSTLFDFGSSFLCCSVSPSHRIAGSAWKFS